eukprot:gene5970-6915_t
MIESTISKSAHTHFKATPLHRARQLCKEDFSRFDYIFAMDADNLRNIKKLYQVNNNGKGSTSEIKLIGDYHPSGGKVIIEDPYYEPEGLENGI